MFRKQNLCPRSKYVFDLKQKHFLVSEQQNLFPQHMFPARLNWETFVSATMFPQQCFLVYPGLKCYGGVLRKRVLILGLEILALLVASHYDYSSAESDFIITLANYLQLSNTRKIKAERTPPSWD